MFTNLGDAQLIRLFPFLYSWSRLPSVSKQRFLCFKRKLDAHSQLFDLRFHSNHAKKRDGSIRIGPIIHSILLLSVNEYGTNVESENCMRFQFHLFFLNFPIEIHIQETRKMEKSDGAIKICPLSPKSAISLTQQSKVCNLESS